MTLPRGAMGLSAVCDCFFFLIKLTYYFRLEFGTSFSVVIQLC